MPKPCICSDLPYVFGVEETRFPFQSLETLDEKQNAFLTLCRCPHCGQHWQIDAWDQHYVRLAKIADPEDWADFDDKPVRLAVLVNSRGGLSKAACKWPRCEGFTVRGLDYCAFHILEASEEGQ